MVKLLTEEDKQDAAKYIFDNNYFRKQLSNIEECAELSCKHLTCKFARNWNANIHKIRVNR